MKTVHLLDPEKLAEAMRECGATQEQLAEQAGVTQQAVSYLLQAPRNAKVETVARIAKALSVPLDGLLSQYRTSEPDTYAPSIAHAAEMASRVGRTVEELYGIDEPIPF